MKKKHISIILLLLVSHLGFSQYVKSNMLLEVLDYGIMQSDSIRTDTLTQMHEGFDLIESRNAKIIKRTDTVPAVLGVHFGVMYVLKQPKVQAEQLKVEWEFPTEVKGTKILTFYRVGHPFRLSYSSYTFDDERELVKGTWQLRIYNKNKLLLVKDFVVI